VTDSHAHLDARDVDAAAAVARARAAGVTRIVTIGTGIESCRAALEIAEANDGVYAALGIDPHQAGTAEANRVDELRELLAHPKAVAVGEAGLDPGRRLATPEQQRRLLVELAAELDLPVVIHNREADEETARALEGFGGTVVLHCFSSPDLVPVATERGYFVSFAGNATYPNAAALRDAATAIARDRILVETDTPYLAPQPLRGKPNEPAHVVHTIGSLAEARGERAEELAAATHSNAAAAFALP
jgi:TatD DNase family protein